MKIAMPVDAPNPDGRIENRLGTAPYLLVVDTETLRFEAVEGPPRSSGPGAGIQIVALAVGMGAEVLLTGYVAPYIAQTLQKSGIRVITSVSGRAGKAVEDFQRGAFDRAGEEDDAPAHAVPPAQREVWQDALGKATRQFLGMMPILIGVILLVGLFRVFLTGGIVGAVFSGNPLTDTLWGACAGSLLAGNPVNSYVVGRTLLDTGVGLWAVTALMLSWVGVGLVQMPAEMKALGARFAVLRNTAAFVLILIAAPAMVWALGKLGG